MAALAARQRHGLGRRGRLSDGRAVTWEGFFNARDLGGLPTRDGRLTRRGALIRSADLRFVTGAGWRSAYDAGIRTVVDLRNDDEVGPGAGPGLTALGGTVPFVAGEPLAPVPAGIDTVRLPLDGVEDVEFWRQLNGERLNGTPLYFGPFLERKPERCAAAVAAVANARPGGVIFHCGGGRDRTGLLALLLLALAGVEPGSIAADYELSTEPRRALLAAMGRDDDVAVYYRSLADKGTTAHAAVLATLEGLDAERYLRSAGLGPEEIARVRSRLLEGGCRTVGSPVDARMKAPERQEEPDDPAAEDRGGTALVP